MKGVCVITGGSRGIGASCVELAAAKGYNVCFSYSSDEEAAQTVMNNIKSTGVSARYVKADVSIEKDVMNLFTAADEMGPLTGLVNNAGVLDVAQRVDELSAGRLSRIFNVNLLGSFLCAREAVKRMSTRHGGKGGAIVNLSSAAAYLGSPNQFVDYAASKAAIDTLTKGLSLEVADEGIRVNAVRPGLIKTDIHASMGLPERVSDLEESIPMKRGGEPLEVARAILWLMSEDASYITGDCLNITGGR